MYKYLIKGPPFMKIIYPLLLSSLLTNLYAEPEIYANAKILSLEDLMTMSIISSTGTEQRISDAPSIASVITAQQIERSSARTLSEVLQMVPGMQGYLTPANAQNYAYDIRGIRTGFNPQILTLINGVGLDSVRVGSRIPSFTFPASAIQRVEVIRGPGSAVYGADAFAGVINIITKDAEYLQNNSQTGVRYGSFDTTEVYGSYGEIYKSGLELGVNLSYMTSNGDKGRVIESDLQTTLDGIFSTSASLAPGAYDDRYNVYNMNLNLSYEKFSMNLWAYLAKDMGVGAGIANSLDHEGKAKNSEFIADLNHDNKPMEDVKWNNKIVLSYIDNNNYLNIFPTGAVLPIGDDGNAFTPGGGLVLFPDGYIGNPASKEKKITFESTLNISKFENQNIRVSAGYSYVEFTASATQNFGPGVIDGTTSPIDGTLIDATGIQSLIYLPDEDRKTFFLSLQDEYSLSKDLSLTVGVRYDNYSDFGNTINPRLGLVWNTSEEFTTKILYGRAFRAPSFTEQYTQNNPIALGNDSLNPETIDMIEWGTQYSPNSKLASSINLYWYEINDGIQTVGTSPSIAQNIGKQNGAGVEMELSYQASKDLLFMADYAYRWTDNIATKEAVADVPKHLAHVMFDYSITHEWFLNSEVSYTADTPREGGDTRAKIDNYAVVNLSTGYRVTNGLEAVVAARNLFDEEYVHPSTTNPVGDYPMEGINLFAELRYSF